MYRYDLLKNFPIKFKMGTEFDAAFESVKKVAKRLLQKKLFIYCYCGKKFYTLQHFSGNLFCNFFNGFPASNSAFFLYPY
jgi:hypothetical protein